MSGEGGGQDTPSKKTKAQSTRKKKFWLKKRSKIAFSSAFSKNQANNLPDFLIIPRTQEKNICSRGGVRTTPPPQSEGPLPQGEGGLTPLYITHTDLIPYPGGVEMDAQLLTREMKKIHSGWSFKG